VELKKFWTLNNLLIALLSGVIIFLSLKLNRALEPLVLLAPGICWLFLPAGVKLLLVLMGRFPAVVGMFFSSLLVGMSSWTDKDFLTIVYLSFISVACYPGATTICQKWLGILKDFDQTQYWHIAVLSLIATLMDVLIHNIIYFWQGWVDVSDYLSKTVFVATGDFLGGFVVIALFRWGLQKISWFGRALKNLQV
jgi:hypothetical protein